MYNGEKCIFCKKERYSSKFPSCHEMLSCFCKGYFQRLEEKIGNIFDVGFMRAFQWYHLQILMSKNEKKAPHICKVENIVGFVLFNPSLYGEDVKANNLFDATM